VPYGFTAESIRADDPPAIMCDYCVQQHYPDTFAELLAERRYFWEN